MKDNEHSYLFKEDICFGFSYKMARLDYIRTYETVTLVCGQYAKKGPTDLAIKLQEIFILLVNLNVPKGLYPSKALGGSVCLNQGILCTSE